MDGTMANNSLVLSRRWRRSKEEHCNTTLDAIWHDPAWGLLICLRCCCQPNAAVNCRMVPTTPSPPPPPSPPPLMRRCPLSFPFFRLIALPNQLALSRYVRAVAKRCICIHRVPSARSYSAIQKCTSAEKSPHSPLNTMLQSIVIIRQTLSIISSINH